MAEEKKEASKKKNGRISSAKKRELQSLKREVRGRGFKASVNTAIRAFQTSLGQGDSAQMLQKLNEVYSLLDKGVKTNKFKLNKAARTKSRLSNRLQALSKE